MYYTVDKSNYSQIYQHLLRCSKYFIPPLELKVNLVDYSRKIANNASRFEAWDGEILIGLVAVYMNDLARDSAFITSVSVDRNHAGKGVAAKLLSLCSKKAIDQGFKALELEVSKENEAAFGLYSKFGFALVEEDSCGSVKLALKLV